MPLFNEFIVLRGKHKPTDFDINIARSLLSIIRDKRRLTGPINMITWSKSIQLLRRVDKTPEKQIIQVLKWLEVHLKDEYTPLVLSAKMFRAKFGQLLLAMERSGPTLAEVSPRAIKVEQRLAGLHWPKGSKDKLAPYIQQTIDTTEHLARRLKLLTFAIDGPEYNTVRKLATRIVETLRAHQFVEEWWRTVNRQVSNWEDWNGDLRSHTFKPDSNKVDKMCEEIAHRYCQDSQQWKKLKSLLQEHIE